MNARERTEGARFGRYMGIEELRQYMNVGEGTARKIGTEAGAVIKCGRRVLYDRERIDAYMTALFVTE